MPKFGYRSIFNKKLTNSHFYFCITTKILGVFTKFTPNPGESLVIGLV